MVSWLVPRSSKVWPSRLWPALTRFETHPRGLLGSATLLAQRAGLVLVSVLCDSRVPAFASLFRGSAPACLGRRIRLRPVLCSYNMTPFGCTHLLDLVRLEK